MPKEKEGNWDDPRWGIGQAGGERSGRLRLSGKKVGEGENELVNGEE